MKKVLLPLCVALLGIGLVSCGETPATSTPVEEAQSYKLSVGNTIEFATAEGTGVLTEMTVLTFAVVFDAEGKVVSSYTDTVQIPLVYADGALSYDASKKQVEYGSTADYVLSKRELGTVYGSMPEGTWYVQADAFQDGIEGKTLAEIKELKAGEGDIAGCTMKGTTPDFIEAIEVGTQEVHTVEFESTEVPSVGVGLTVAEAGAKLTVETAGVAFNGETVVAASFDAYQAPVAEGKLTAEKVITKKELGDAYGSMPAGTWLPQANAYEELIAGKTVAEVQALTLEEVGAAGCTMKSTPAVFARNVKEAHAHSNVSGYTGETLTLA